jgi:hypothetical protein
MRVADHDAPGRMRKLGSAPGRVEQMPIMGVRSRRNDGWAAQTGHKRQWVLADRAHRLALAPCYFPSTRRLEKSDALRRWEYMCLTNAVLHPLSIPLR